MATPPAYGAPPPMMEHPEIASLKSILNLAKILALIVMVLAVLGALSSIYTGLTCNGIFGCSPGGSFGWAGYLLVSAVVMFLVWQRVPSIEALVNNRQYAQAKNDVLLWMILGFIFGFIIGLILLLGYIKFDPIIASGGAVPMSMVGGYAAQPGYGQPAPYAPQPGYGQPPAYGSPPAYGQPVAAAPAPAASPASSYPAPPATAPVAPAPPIAPAAAPGTTPCPRCGRPLTWIPQYSRWYCYSDQQYA